MKVSVIIPARNAGNTLARQLDALCAQQGGTVHEVLLADNGSRDRTREIFRTYADRLPRLRMIDASAGVGVSQVRNIGVSHATGDTFCFCDADDMVEISWVRGMAASLERADLVTGPVRLERLNETWVVRSRERLHGDLSQRAPTAGWKPFAIGANLGVRRRAFEGVGGFDESMHASEDIDLSWRVQLAGGTFEFNPDTILHYRLRHSRRQLFRQAWHYGRWYVCLVRKHAPHGYVAESWTVRTIARRWWHTFQLLPGAVRSRAEQAKFLFEAGTHLGHMAGSIRYRFPVP